MAGKVFFSVSMSLDGFIAPESLDDLMGQQWMELFGSGIRLFEGVDAGRVALEPVRAEPTQRVTHLTYTVHER